MDVAFVTGLDAGPITRKITSKLDGWVPPHPVGWTGCCLVVRLCSRRTSPCRRIDARCSSRRAAASLRARSTCREADASVPPRRLCADDHHDARGLHPVLGHRRVRRRGPRRHVLVRDDRGRHEAVSSAGSISVRVDIAADSRHVDQARVSPTIGVSGAGSRR